MGIANHAVAVVVAVAPLLAFKGVAGCVILASIAGRAQDLLELVAVGCVVVGLGLGPFTLAQAVANAVVAVTQVTVGAAGAGQAIEFVVAELLVSPGLE
ncbi:MAG: hypothetical protein P8179_07710 [Candidatus Thiodiazotropha sp.]